MKIRIIMLFPTEKKLLPACLLYGIRTGAGAGSTTPGSAVWLSAATHRLTSATAASVSVLLFSSHFKKVWSPLF